ncbi:MAG: hypothetical protein ACJAYU_001888 [Bradymonadia bacterium]|jgi:hypothetical protein
MTTEPDAIGADAIGADANMSDGGTVAIAPFVVGAEWLIANLDGIQVLDPRDAEAFDAAHVPGALPFAPSSVRGSVDGVGSPLPGFEMTCRSPSSAPRSTRTPRAWPGYWRIRDTKPCTI